MTLDDLLKVAATPTRRGREPIGEAFLDLRGLTAGDVHDLNKLLTDDDSLHLHAMIVARAALDSDGSPMFGDVVAGAEKLKGLPGHTLTRLYQAVDRLSDVEPGGTAELLGNSGARAGDSSNGSP